MAHKPLEKNYNLPAPEPYFSVLTVAYHLNTTANMYLV